MKVKEFGRVLFAKGAVRTVLEIQNVAVSTCEGGRFGRLLDAWGAVRTDHKIENVAVVEEAVDSVKSPTHFETSPSDNNRLQCRRPCDEWKPPGLVKLPLELL